VLTRRRYDTKETELLYAICDERLGTARLDHPHLQSSRRRLVQRDPVIGGAILDRLASPAIKMIIEKAIVSEGRTEIRACIS